MMSLCVLMVKRVEDTDAKKRVPYGVCERESVCERRCESSRESTRVERVYGLGYGSGPGYRPAATGWWVKARGSVA